MASTDKPASGLRGLWKSLANNLTTGWKYGTALLVTLLIFAFSMLYIYGTIQDLREHLDTVERIDNSMYRLSQASALFNEAEAQVFDYITYNNTQRIQDFAATHANLSATLETLESAAIKSPEFQQQLDRLNDHVRNLNELFTRDLIGAAERNQRNEMVLVREYISDIKTSSLQMIHQLEIMAERERVEAMDSTNRTLSTTLVITLISLLASAVIGTGIVSLSSLELKRQFKRLIMVSDRIASGDLSVRLEPLPGKNEIHRLTRSVSAMADNLRNLIRKMSAVSGQVSEQSGKLLETSGIVKEDSASISNTMEQLAAGTEEQAGTAGEIAHIVEQLNTSIQQVNQTGAMVGEASTELKQLALEGNDRMQESMATMEQIHAIVSTSVERVKKLETQAAEITTLVEVINQIAGQTRLLALNAAIEAARAGEAGRGFGVVAFEIRKLSEQVEQSISTITGIVQGIQSESKSVASALETGYGRVEAGSRLINLTGETFQSILQDVINVADGVERVGGHLAEIARNSDMIQTSIESIASIAQETAAGVQETSATVQQQHHAVETILQYARELSGLTEDLNRAVAQFKL